MSTLFAYLYISIAVRLEVWNAKKYIFIMLIYTHNIFHSKWYEADTASEKNVGSMLMLPY